MVADMAELAFLMPERLCQGLAALPWYDKDLSGSGVEFSCSYGPCRGFLRISQCAHQIGKVVPGEESADMCPHIT